MSRKRESRAFLRKNLIDPRVPWRHKKQEMMAIARIIQVRMACKFKPISDVGYRLYKRAREQHRRYEICRKRHMSTSTGLSAMEWRSCLPLHLGTSVCQLEKHQRVSSGSSHLIKGAVWTRCDGRKNLSRYRKSMTERQKSKNQLEFFWKSTPLKSNAIISTRQCLWKLFKFLESEAGWHSEKLTRIIEHYTSYCSNGHEDFLGKRNEASEQHRSIRRGEWVEGPSLAITAIIFLEFTYLFRLSVSIT